MRLVSPLPDMVLPEPSRKEGFCSVKSFCCSLASEIRSHPVSPVQLGIHCIAHTALTSISLPGAGVIGVSHHACLALAYGLREHNDS